MRIWTGMAELSAFGTQLVRRISTTACVCGKRNFKKFPIYNKRGTKQFKAEQFKNPDPRLPIHHYGARFVGVVEDGKFVKVPEMIPQLVVPDLTGFKLKPYVSYRAPQVTSPPLTPEELFGQIYAAKIRDDFSNGRLGPDNEPLDPSPEEKLTAEEARARLSRMNTDIV